MTNKFIFQSVFDDYKFVTKVELHELGLGDLEGTLMLRPFMHGFYIDARLYRKVKIFFLLNKIHASRLNN